MPVRTDGRLPSGTVTFLLSDIEGSTRLFHRLGSAYAALLAEHRELLRSAVQRHGGVEVDTEGDALLAAFGDAAAAVAAALDAQRALSAHPWPAGGEIRVRMGLHTGEAEPAGGGYVALAVHQVARISAGAHGGQVLMSEATVTATGRRMPDEAEAVALGSFQLRGFPTPERLFELHHPDLRSDFPPLRALGVVAHNLPFQRTGFIGRSAERSAVATLLKTTGVVSVVGPGGVGKTRLAVQVAFDVMDGYADGAWLVEFAPLTDPALVPRAVAAAVRVAEQPGRELEDVLLEALAPRELLLVLDNCEHLLDAVAVLAERLSQHCPHLAVLVTSREPLDVDGEAVWRLEPLPTVDPAAVAGAASLAEDDATALFLDRASLARPGFRLTDANAADVARLIAHLDGMPLALELAAATLADRSLTAVVQGLTDRFTLLSRGRRTAPGRHQTLRAALEWSLDLLPEKERRVFARLAAFAGSGTVEAAAVVCAGSPVAEADVVPAVHRLIRASLLVAHPELADRWSMLESMRELAYVELRAAGEAATLAQRHRSWFVSVVEAVENDIGRTDRSDVMRELTADHDNVRRALDSAVADGDPDSGLRLAAAMTPYWTSAGHWTEGSERLRAVLALRGGDGGARARALVAAGNLRLLRGDFPGAETAFAEARERAADAADDVALARALSGTGYIAFRQSRLEESKACWDEALIHAESAGDERVAAGVLRSLAIAAGSKGDQAEAGHLLERAVASARRVGDDQLLRQLLGSSAERELWLGDYARAEEEYADALEIATAIGDLSARPLLLAELGWVALLRGDPREAARLAVEASELAEDLGNPRVLLHGLRLRGEALLRLGRMDDAATALDDALAAAESFGAPAEVAGVRCSQAELALERLQRSEACRLADQALDRSALPHPMRVVTPHWVSGLARLLDGDLDGAERDFRSGLLLTATGTPRHAASGHWGLGRVSAARGRFATAVAEHTHSLRLRTTMGTAEGIAESLIGLAAAAAGLQPENAARLLGAASALRAASGLVPTPRQDADVAAVRAALTEAADDATFAAAHEAGTGLDAAAATALALQMNEELGERVRQRT